jgi:archaemetzincin
VKYSAISIILGAFSLLGCSENQPLKVGLQPFGNFEPSLTDTISITLEKNYGLKTYVLSPISIPGETFVNVKTPRYRADKIISILKMQKPDSIDFVIGLTAEDISITKKEDGKVKEPRSKYEDWGVFGFGYVPGPSSIVSSFRLNNKVRAVLIERLKKVATHELGHNMGLSHCNSENCVMRDAAESIKTIDLVDCKLCDQCKKRI